MKKLLGLAVCLGLVASASAATLNWGAATIKFDSTSLKNSEAVNGYLIYLGGAGTAFSASYDISSDSVSTIVSSIGTQVATANKPNALGTFNIKSTFDTSKYGNGDVFGMLLTYTNEGKTYYNLSTATIGMTGLVEEPPTDPDKMTFSFSYASGDDAKTVSAGGGWHAAVPEPSTAMLALAGLALLIKRRRA